MLVIVDYDMANLRSVQKALEAVGHSARIVRTPAEVALASHLILPGVGAFRDAIATLRARGLDKAVLDHIHLGRPFLGICLGMQLLFEVGHEDGQHTGLGVLPGHVVRFTPKTGFKIPHMGWNTLRPTTPTPLLTGIADGDYAYFVHSYHIQSPDPSLAASTTDYGGTFTSALARNNIMATQFHPEKSQQVGLRILRNFANLPA
jgi:imidazole glycerol-phosphate synthase subunit HisH